VGVSETASITDMCCPDGCIIHYLLSIICIPIIGMQLF
jgi:hypothetical protein